MKEIPGNLKNQGNSGLFFIFFSSLFFFLFFFLYHVFIVKVQESVWRAKYDENKTIKQSNDPVHLVIVQTHTPHP